MPPSGRVLFGEMDEVVFGKPAAEAIAAQVHRLGMCSARGGRSDRRW
jgi:hypothetical protein